MVTFSNQRLGYKKHTVYGTYQNQMEATVVIFSRIWSLEEHVIYYQSKDFRAH